MKVVLKVFKWDDDLAVELPKELVDRLSIKEGNELEILAAPPQSRPGIRTPKSGEAHRTRISLNANAR